MGGVFNYVNLHVYHYAGNNPVKYVDPDGRISFDEDTITCDLTDKLDMLRALTAFNTMDFENGRYAYNQVIASDGKGFSITFNNRKVMTSIVNSDVDCDALREEFGKAGLTLISGVGLLDVSPSLNKSLGNVSAIASAVSFGMSLETVFDNPNPDTISDLVISGVGFFGAPGAAISIGLTIGKGAVKATKEMAGATSDFASSVYQTYKKDPMRFLYIMESYSTRNRHP
jgi:hypothetical protein